MIGCSKGGERGGVLATASPHTSSTKMEAMATHDAVQWINSAYTRGEPPIMTFSLSRWIRYDMCSGKIRSQRAWQPTASYGNVR